MDMKEELQEWLGGIIAEANRHDERQALRAALEKLQEVDQEHVTAERKNAYDVWVVPTENPAEMNVVFMGDGPMNHGTILLSTGQARNPTQKMKLGLRSAYMEALAATHPRLVVFIEDGKWAISS